jgi:SAM-dependent methyltransferase
MLLPIRRAYRALVPELLRRRARKPLIGSPALYSRGYYRDLDHWQQTGYPAMARSIVDLFTPGSVIDAGCGTGGLLAELRALGVRHCHGIDLHEEALAVCRERGLDVERGDLSRPLWLDRRFSLCLCLEVAEHIPLEAADQLVVNLSSGPAELIFSAATPGQGGHDHVNEQPRGYWLAKFEAAGWRYEEDRAERLQHEWSNSGVARWYADNVLVFRRDSEPRS